MKFFSLLPLAFFYWAAQPTMAGDPRLALIPQPVSLQEKPGHFLLSSKTGILVSGGAEVNRLGQFLSDFLRVPTGHSLAVLAASHKEGGTFIRLRLNPQTPMASEGYTLEVAPAHVEIVAKTPAGLFYGIQTLLQLLPPDIERKHKTPRTRWEIPCVHIADEPRFGWRGLMLDVSRHFFPKTFVKKYIDQLSRYKMNVFHWHLTDDNGWRIEIKSLPKLTEIGAWRVPRTGRWGNFDPPQPGEKATEGGYYTQEDIKEIVAYAKARFVTIVPEIDVPGHSLAAIAAYPELSTTGLQYAVNPGSRFYGIEDNALSPAKAFTYEFLDKVFTEVAQLFPGKYIHVGGDECYKGFWKKDSACQQLMRREGLKNEEELQSYFEKKVEKILISKGKKLIGWDEILEGGLAPEASVMSWRGMQGGIAAAKMNHYVVMSPTTHCYLDLYQGDPVSEPPTYSMLRLNTTYQFEPVPQGVDPTFILGGQGNLWTESVPNERHAEYMTWPRAFALAEVLWSPKSVQHWDDFVRRMEMHFQRYDAADIKYARSAYDPIFTPFKDAEGNLQIVLGTEVNGLDVYYSFDNTDPDPHYPKYEQPLHVPKGANMIKAVSYRGRQQAGRLIAMPLDELRKRMKKNN